MRQCETSPGVAATVAPYPDAGSSGQSALICHAALVASSECDSVYDAEAAGAKRASAVAAMAVTDAMDDLDSDINTDLPWSFLPLGRERARRNLRRPGGRRLPGEGSTSPGRAIARPR
jgi:hypothetical protein